MLTVAEPVREIALGWAFTGPARVLVTRDAKVLFVSKAAEELFSTSRLVGVVDGTVKFANVRDSRRFASFLATVGDEVTVAAVSRDSGAGLLFSAQTIETEHGVVVCLHVAPRSASLRALRERFGLTRSEDEVLQSLLGGMRVNEIAEARGLSVATVRSHVRGIYSKLGVNSREQLFSRARDVTS